MLIGSRERFAIEAQPEEFSGDWILGRFRFWVGGEEVGDWNDSTDLRGCVSWLKDFATVPRDRSDPRLDGASPEDVFALVYDPVFGPNGIANPSDQPIPFSYERFHIGHVGMSSFERFDVLLVKTATGRGRCIWRKADDVHIFETILDAGEMEEVATRFCEDFETTYGRPKS